MLHGSFIEIIFHKEVLYACKLNRQNLLFQKTPVISSHFPVFHRIDLAIFPFKGWPFYAAAACWRSVAAASGDIPAWKLLMSCISEFGVLQYLVNLPTHYYSSICECIMLPVPNKLYLHCF
jgi:hypothetical protein